ncbi:MAG: Rpn family recombination-promoting nuclease/putative transposase [Bacteroidales bacterium]|nr:Rpn family recombination-promoting nuclease/putative transposase [Bacteroidales bacterium]
MKNLEEPRIKYISHKAKGVYANILLDDWFKRTFEELPSSKRLLTLLLQELIPERRIVDIKYAPQEHTNPNPDKRGIRVDVEATDADGTRFLVEMQREPQDFFYERAVYNASHCVIRQMEIGEDEYDFPSVYFIGLVDFPLHRDPDRVLYRYSIYEDTDKELMTDRLHYILLELPNCGRALGPDATVLDNFCFSMHNMQFLEERPADLRQEIFELLFDAANIATFAPEDRIKYEYAMTTERDIRNQIRYAEKQGLAQGMEQGMKQGKEQGALEVARRMLSKNKDIAEIVEFTGLSEEQVRTLMPPQTSA